MEQGYVQSHIRIHHAALKKIKIEYPQKGLGFHESCGGFGRLSTWMDVVFMLYSVSFRTSGSITVFIHE